MLEGLSVMQGMTHPGGGVRNHYFVVSRDADDNLQVKETFDFYVACGLQLSMLRGGSLEDAVAHLCSHPADMKDVFTNLLNDAFDRVADEDKEVTLYLLRARRSFK